MEIFRKADGPQLTLRLLWIKIQSKQILWNRGSMSLISQLCSWCVSLETASSTTSTRARTWTKAWRSRCRPVQGRSSTPPRPGAGRHHPATLTDAASHRQEKEAWIKAKYVEKKFLKKLGATEILINGERKSERRWSVKKCRRHNSATTVPKTRRRYRQEPGSTSPSTLSAGTPVCVSLVMCV